MFGLVLAGGKSARMGEDKALIKYNGVEQYKFIESVLGNFCEKVFISSNTIKSNNIIKDDENLPHFYGPVNGLITAFNKYPNSWFVVAVDYPALNTSILEKLFIAYMATKSTKVFYNLETHFYEPFIGIYTPDFLAEIKNRITEYISLQQILQEKNNCQFKITNPKLLANINTKQEYLNFINNHEAR